MYTETINSLLPSGWTALTCMQVQDFPSLLLFKDMIKLLVYHYQVKSTQAQNGQRTTKIKLKLHTCTYVYVHSSACRSIPKSSSSKVQRTQRCDCVRTNKIIVACCWGVQTTCRQVPWSLFVPSAFHSPTTKTPSMLTTCGELPCLYPPLQFLSIQLVLYHFFFVEEACVARSGHT